MRGRQATSRACIIAGLGHQRRGVPACMVRPRPRQAQQRGGRCWPSLGLAALLALVPGRGLGKPSVCHRPPGRASRRSNHLDLWFGASRAPLRVAVQKYARLGGVPRDGRGGGGRGRGTVRLLYELNSNVTQCGPCVEVRGVDGIGEPYGGERAYDCSGGADCCSRGGRGCPLLSAGRRCLRDASSSTVRRWGGETGA